MNTIFTYATKHSNEHLCHKNNPDRLSLSLQPIENRRKSRIQIDVSKNYTGKQFRLLAPKQKP